MQFITIINFNPRTHRGVRLCNREKSDKLFNFNPRTHRGVRRYLKILCMAIDMYFNPRTHRGVRPTTARIVGMYLFDFNPRTHRGVRLQKEGLRP